MSCHITHLTQVLELPVLEMWLLLYKGKPESVANGRGIDLLFVCPHDLGSSPISKKSFCNALSDVLTFKDS